jgi:hypothetical protein
MIGSANRSATQGDRRRRAGPTPPQWFAAKVVKGLVINVTAVMVRS